MDTIKHILKPGHRQEDELLYGDGSSNAPANQAGGSNAPTRQAGTSQSNRLPEFNRTASGTISGLSSSDRVTSQHAGSSSSSGFGGVIDPASGKGPANTGSEYTSGNLYAPRPSAPLDRVSSASIKSGVVGNPQETGLTNLSAKAAPIAGETERPMGEKHVPATSAVERDLPDRTANTAYGSTPATEAEKASPATGPHDGREALAGAAAGATVAGTGASVAGHSAHGHGGHGHKFEGDPCDTLPLSESRSGVHHTSGPHATDTANRLDPHFHVPGEFPAETPGSDPHATPNRGPTGGYGFPSSQASRNVPSETTQPPSEQHHYGRNAALGGAGLSAAGGAIASEKHRDTPSEATKPSADQAVSGRGPAQDAIPATANPQRDGSKATTTDTAQPVADQHHYGRDAALACAGAAAAGGAAYAYSDNRAGHKENAPASSAIGSHKGTALTPKADSAPQSITTGGAHTNPYSSTAVDPRVDRMDGSNDRGQTTKDHRYGRDAAVAGGGGTAAIAAAEAARRHGTGREQAQPSTVPSTKQAAAEPPQPPSHVMGRYNDQSFDPTRKASGKAQPSEDRHYGRDAALAGGAGAAGVGAYEAAKHHGDDTKGAIPSREAAGKESLPKVQHQGENWPLTGGAGPTGVGYEVGKYSSDTSKTPAPLHKAPGQGDSSKEHHYGRDAALAGGAGTAGLGAYEASKHYGHDAGAAAPSYSASQQKTVPKDHHFGRDAALAGVTGTAGLGTYEAGRHHGHSGEAAPTRQLETLPSEHQYLKYGGDLDSTTAPSREPAVSETAPKEHHYGRDAALAGGAGTAGYGAYEASKQHDDTAAPSREPVASDTTPKEHHYGRDATLAGGAGAAGLGAYGANRHHRDDSGAAMQSPTTAQHEQPQSHKGRDAAAVAGTGAAGATAAHEYSKRDAEKAAKEQEKAQKAHEKELSKEQEKAQKAHEKEAAKHQKALEKQESKHQKELEKEEKKHQKEVEKEEKKDRKGGLLGSLLHRKDKSKDEDGHEHEHEDEATAAAAGTGAAGTAAYEEGKHHKHNKLHKEPPPSHPAAQTHHHGNVDAEGRHIGTDGPINDPKHISGLHETRAGEYGAVDPLEERSGVVQDPHTGLPMHVGKYGDGHGGTDGSPQIGGAVHHAAQSEHHADWDAIKKANTLY